MGSGGYSEHTGSCVKGAACIALDKLSSDRGGLIALQAAIANLAPVGYRGLENALGQKLMPVAFPPAECERLTRHLKQRWFDAESDKCYFPGVDVARLYGEGMLKTIELALTSNLPIDTWWSRDHGTVEMLNLPTPRQITLVIGTPRLANNQLPP